jgi:hypothetical protein
MNRKTFDKLVKNYDSQDEILVSRMALLIEKYPYFQLPRFYYTKSLKDQNKNELDIALNQLALYTADRGFLKENIEYELKKKGDLLSVEIESTTVDREISVKKHQKVTKPKEKAVVKSKTRSTKSRQISGDLKMSFLEWIQFIEENKKIELKKLNKKDPLINKLPIIDRFIKADPKISPLSTAETVASVMKQEYNSEELMTEALAKILVKQKKYKKAISAYKILSLKYPEKNVFFAGQILKIKKLQQQ